MKSNLSWAREEIGLCNQRPQRNFKRHMEEMCDLYGWMDG